MSKKQQSRNKTMRANGNEPKPDFGAGVKRWARYLARVGHNTRVKDPMKYLTRHGT